LTLLHRAIRRLEDESAGACKPKVFERLISYFAPAGDAMPYRETAAPVVVKEDSLLRELLSEDAILRDEVLDSVLLSTIDPAREDKEQELPWL